MSAKEELFAYSTIRGISIPHFAQIQPTISGVFGCVKWEEEQQFNNMLGDPLMQNKKYLKGASAKITEL